MVSETTRDTIAGAAGGVAQVLIDIVKVRLQTSGGSGLAVARNIWLKEGPLAFYKGSLPPLIGISICGSIQFGAFQYFRQLFQNRQNKTGNSKDTLPIWQLFVAGGGAGLANSVISGPVEHIRIRLQTQPSGSGKLYNGPVDCARKIYQQAGIAGIFRGQVATMVREFYGFGAWFASYEVFVSLLTKMDNKSRSELPSWKIAICGGLAGEVNWLLANPFDVIKSRLQSDGFGEGRRYKNTRDAVLKTWKTQGFGGFMEGLGPSLLRALPVSAGIFATVEIVRTIIG
ncbi:unnamed protein product [Clonostachys rosea]|uniref:Mitochondrial thiamine pyrophosphate carrier 1 n=1 Tax=Bionectria ochroleuca TaxID=29856 RepID=A0ABY6U012_BIOOC|nr:unnamed protein product [Clonostachys rosea]